MLQLIKAPFSRILQALSFARCFLSAKCGMHTAFREVMELIGLLGLRFGIMGNSDIIFGLFIFMRGMWRWLACAAALVFIGPKVAVMFPAWLAGVAAYQFCNKQYLSYKMGWLLFIMSFVLLAIYQFLPHSPLDQFINFSFSAERLESTAQDYFLTLCFVINIIGFSTISERFAGCLARRAKIIRWIAGGTFSIYLVHLPIMYLLSAIAPWPKSSPWTLALLLIATPIICMMFAEISERRKDVWRQVLLSLITKGTSVYESASRTVSSCSWRASQEECATATLGRSSAGLTAFSGTPKSGPEGAVLSPLE